MEHTLTPTELTAHRRLFLLLCVTIASLSLVWGESTGASSNPDERPKIGLALSGGGARGAAHIGVLKVLEQHRIPVDFIAGTSMGAIVGGLYASGMSPQELETLISHIDWMDAFVDRIPREDRSFRRKRDDDLYLIKNKPGLSGGKLKFPLGLLDGQKIDLLLKRYTLPAVMVRNFDDLSIPYRAVVTDLETGETVIIGRGDLALAMRASMSIPVVFAPREMGGRLLVDGGVSSNLPIDVVHRMGADVVIAVDISTDLLEREELNSVLAVTEQLSNILTRRDTDLQIESLTDRDIFIKPELGDITSASFDRAPEAVPAGLTAAEAVLGELERLSVPAEDYRTYLAGRERRFAPPIIDELKIVNQSRLADGVITSRLNVESGESLDIDQLEKDLGQIYGLELFESVYYDITSDSARTVLTVNVRENSWGPNYLQFGVVIFEDYEGPNFNLAAAYSRTALNRLNGEWRSGLQIGREPGLFTELYQPLDKKLRNFIHVQAWLGEEAVSIFNPQGKKLSELGVRRYGIGLSLGRELGTWGEIRGGLMRETGKMKIQIGDPSSPDSDFDTGEVFLQCFVDELDDITFPHSGGTIRIRLSAGLEAFGSSTEYEQAIIDGAYVYSRGCYTGLFSGLLSVTQNSDAPFHRLFHLGGFTRLSGFEHDELGGQHAALLAGTFYRRIGHSMLLPFYAGFSIEYGNVFQERSKIDFSDGIAAGSIFVGLDTIIGPIYLAYGRAEGDRGNFYLFLGRSFIHRRAGFMKWPW